MKSALLILSLILAACSGLPTAPSPGEEVQQPGTVQLQAERTSSTTVLLTLRNDSGSSVGYNLCTSAMERRSGDGWSAVPSDAVCTMELRTLEQGRSATFERRIPSDLAAGEYRFVTPVESPIGSRQERIVSNSITIG